MALRLLHLNSSYIESDQRTLPLQSLELSIKHLEFISDWVLDSHQNSKSILLLAFGYIINDSLIYTVLVMMKKNRYAEIELQW